jgi:Redoxin
MQKTPGFVLKGRDLGNTKDCFPQRFSDRLGPEARAILLRGATMMWNRGWAALAVGVGLLLALAGGSSAQEKTKPVLIKAGVKAPEIAGEHTFNGKALNLSGLKGKVVLVDFWAVWCGPCIRAFPALAALQEEFKSQDFVVLGATSYQNIYGFDKKAGKLRRSASV